MNDYLIEFSRRELPEIMPRELKIPMDGRFAVAVVGPRRSGKTFYFFQLIGQLGREIPYTLILRTQDFWTWASGR